MSRVIASQNQADLFAWQPPQSTPAVDPRSLDHSTATPPSDPPRKSPSHSPYVHCGGGAEHGAQRPATAGCAGQIPPGGGACDRLVAGLTNDQESTGFDLSRNPLRTASPQSLSEARRDPRADADRPAHGDGDQPAKSRPEPAPAGAVDPRDSTQGEVVGGAPTLRTYQVAAIEAVQRELVQHRSTLLVLPTGTGKTVCFAELARMVVADRDRALVLAHRGELLDQAAKKLSDVGIRSYLDQGKNIAPLSASVVVGSLATMRGARLERYPRDFFKLIVVDEGHHAAAAGYQNILGHFATAKVLGVTATPRRGDGKPLGDTFETVAFTYAMRAAMADGYLAPLVARRILVADLDLSEIRTRAGDFAQDELSAAMSADKALLGVVRPMLDLGGDRKGLVFGVDVAHAKALAKLINRFKPGSAVAIDGSATEAERKAVLALYRRGAFQYLCNCALYTEGFDEPDIAMVVLARPTQSWTLYVQMLGRGTRLAAGKTDCLILDCVGNSARHRLIGPVDALAGFVVDERTASLAAAASTEGAIDLEKLLASAEEEASAQRSAEQRKSSDAAVSEYRTRVVNLFVGDQLPPFDPNCAEAKRPATLEQLASIEAAKLGKPPFGVSEAEAAAILAGLAKRELLGLCTVAQARMLHRTRMDTKRMTKARASALIGKFIGRVEREGDHLWATPWVVFGSEPEFNGGKRAA